MINMITDYLAIIKSININQTMIYQWLPFVFLTFSIILHTWISFKSDFRHIIGLWKIRSFSCGSLYTNRCLSEELVAYFVAELRKSLSSFAPRFFHIEWKRFWILWNLWYLWFCINSSFLNLNRKTTKCNFRKSTYSPILI